MKMEKLNQAFSKLIMEMEEKSAENDKHDKQKQIAESVEAAGRSVVYALVFEEALDNAPPEIDSVFDDFQLLRKQAVRLMEAYGFTEDDYASQISTDNGLKDLYVANDEARIWVKECVFNKDLQG